MRVALATCARPLVPDTDLEVLIPALERLDVEAVPVAWSDPETAWEAYDVVVLSSTWDYHTRLGEFRGWLRRVAAATRVENPPAVVEWNLDKRYLRELGDAGVPVIPTVWGEPEDPEPVLAGVRERGWEELVVKPRVDLGAHNLVRTRVDGAAVAIAGMPGPFMAQPFLPSLERRGELSLVFLGGELSHALVKRPASGDFRVQPQYGGTHEVVEPPAEAVEIGARAVGAVDASPSGTPPLYARVDLVEGLDGLCCIELELIEPLLFLTASPAAAERLARLIADLG